MIAFFRRTLGSKFALGVLALIMLAFIITGVFTHEMPGTSTGGGAAGGTVATVTDADLVLGYLNPDFFLGGTRQLLVGPRLL